MTTTTLQPGSVLSGYRLEDRVATGPFSEVWKATALLSGGSQVAVKFALNEIGARMLREEEAVARRLRYHTDRTVKVLGLYDGKNAEGPHPYLVMQWAGDSSFRDVLRNISSEDDRARALQIFIEIAGAVGDVHMLGVVHGDLKPENVLIGADDTPVVVDFGLAKERRSLRLERSLSQSLNTEGDLVGGTLAYLPPEAVKGGEASYQGDVYSLGVMLHEVLLDRRPDKALSPESLASLLPEGVLNSLLKALAFEPQDRFRTGGVLRCELDRTCTQLLLTGTRRKLALLKRVVLTGLAALFVAVRYLSVVALLVIYLGMAILAVRFPAVLIGYLPFVLLHVMVRWEGPETPEDLARRQRGAVAWRK